MVSCEEIEQEHNDAPKLEIRSDFLVLIVLVPNKQIFAVVDFTIFAVEVRVRRNILQANRECERHPTRGVHVAEEHISDGISGLVTRVPAL